MRTFIARRIVLGLCLLGSVQAFAQQEQGAPPPVGLQRCAPDVRGMHTLAAVITAIDTRTGVVQAKTDDGVPLTVQFPPSSLAGVKVGETITLHLGFNRGGELKGG